MLSYQFIQILNLISISQICVLYICVSVYIYIYIFFFFFFCFPSSSVVKESACNAGDLDLIPRLGRSPGEGKGYPLQYSGLENSMDCMVHGVEKVRHD